MSGAKDRFDCWISLTPADKSVSHTFTDSLPAIVGGGEEFANVGRTTAVESNSTTRNLMVCISQSLKSLTIKLTKRAIRAPVQRVRRLRDLAGSLLGALRPLPKTTRNLNGQTIAQLSREHDNLPAMMTFMRHEIG